MLRYLFIHNMFDPLSREKLEELKSDEEISKKLMVRNFMELRQIIHFRGAPSLFVVDDTLELKDENILAELFGDEITPEAVKELKIKQPPASDQEIIWQTITDLQLELITTNQHLTDAQLEIELLKGGVL